MLGQINNLRRLHWGYEKFEGFWPIESLGKSEGESLLSPADYSLAFPGCFASGLASFGRRARSIAASSHSSASFPNTISGVIYQAGAFDCVADGQINLSPDSDSLRAARDAMNGWDPTGGCVYYYNPATSTSAWIWSREVRLSIGAHSFAV